MSNSLDPDHTRHFVGPDLCPNCLQRFSADDRFGYFDKVYQARLLERMLKRSASLVMSTTVLKALLGRLDIKRHSPSFFYLQTSI